MHLPIYAGKLRICFHYDDDHDCGSHGRDRDFHDHDCINAIQDYQNVRVYDDHAFYENDLSYVLYHDCALFVYHVYVSFHHDDYDFYVHDYAPLCVYVLLYLYVYVPCVYVPCVNVLYAYVLCVYDLYDHHVYENIHDYANHENKVIQSHLQ